MFNNITGRLHDRFESPTFDADIIVVNELLLD